MRQGRLVAGAAAIVLALGVAACGDDDEEESAAGEAASAETASAETVTVTADEYSFDLSATPTAETTELAFDNVGEEFHVMIFARINEGFTVEEAVELEGEKGSAEVLAQTEAEPGKQTTVEVRGPAEPGEYALLCPLFSNKEKAPHYELGQLEEFSIE